MSHIPTVFEKKKYSGQENFDMTKFISHINSGFPEGTKGLHLILGDFDANVILTYNGKEYSTRSDSTIPN